MTGSGAGPSRRSHTKSRKGCKTCKRRHIRCDETFPQCRNCTKHQVRCDYMESAGSDSESVQSPEQSGIQFEPNVEASIEEWQKTGRFPFPDLQVFPHPRAEECSRNDLRLIYHFASIASDLAKQGTAELTTWAAKFPKFLSVAASYPYVMHALLSHSANHVAWTQSSNEMRNLALQHSSVALRGLHEAINDFSPANADAVLAASLLLLWQATDWRSWSSLRAGIQSVVNAMQNWKQPLVFAEFVAEDDILGNAFRAHASRSPISAMERESLLQNAVYALESLQPTIAGHELASNWIRRLLVYVQQLQSLPPARSPEEQFNYFYQLRKWLFWVPVQLLQSQTAQGPALLTLAHLFAIAIALEPLFPDLGSAFCSSTALPVLQDIIKLTNTMREQHGSTASSAEIGALMQYPQQAIQNHFSRTTPIEQSHFMLETPSFNFDSPHLEYATMGNISPAFAPATPVYNSTNPSSSFLEVPSNYSFSTGTQQFGLPSPGFPPPSYTSDAQDQLYSYGGGYVVPTAIWT